MGDLAPYAFGGIATLFVAIFGWAFGINSRVSVQAQRSEDVKLWIDERTQGILAQVNLRADMTEQRLNRIERALNGYMKHHE